MTTTITSSPSLSPKSFIPASRSPILGSHPTSPFLRSSPKPSPKNRLSRHVATSALAQEGSGRTAVAAGTPDKEQLNEHNYRDSGTQYTPPGYPPTASKKRTTREEKVQKHQTKPSSSFVFPVSTAPGTNPSVTQERPSTTSTSTTTTSSKKSASLSSLVRSPSFTKNASRQGHPVMPMPREYQHANPMHLGALIADLLLELIAINDDVPPPNGILTRFHSRAPPAISVKDYLDRLIFHATLTPPLLLAMVYYIDRLCAMYPAFTINSLTVHRFLITAATVAAKGLSDSFWTNHTYARVGGVSTHELAMLELDFLVRLDWGIVPRPEVLEEYYRSLVARTDGFEIVSDEPEKKDTQPSETGAAEASKPADGDSMDTAE